MPTVAYNCKDTSCDAPDGRVFTIAVCAKDQSGLQSCTQVQRCWMVETKCSLSGAV